MLFRRLFTHRTAVLTLVPALLGFGASIAHAGYGYWGCRCHPSCEVFHSEFYGYYRTCWRPWPGGQPECPVYMGHPVPLAPAKPAETLPPPVQEMPAPMPK